MFRIRSALALVATLTLALSAAPAAHAHKHNPARMVHVRQHEYDVARAHYTRWSRTYHRVLRRDGRGLASKHAWRLARHWHYRSRKALRSKRYWQRRAHPRGSGTAARNQRLGRRMARARGWTGASWRCLRRLWNGESGWNHRAVNVSSGALGIPQALPGSKMRSAGSAIHTALVQIRWGLGYIAGRYGGPCAALRAWLGRSPHWY